MQQLCLGKIITYALEYLQSSFSYKKLRTQLMFLFESNFAVIYTGILQCVSMYVLCTLFCIREQLTRNVETFTSPS